MLSLEAFVSCEIDSQSAVYPKIIESSLNFIDYDPNYNDDEMELDDDEFDEDLDEEDNFSDDDDLSWKVRRAAAKLLQSIMLLPHVFEPNYQKMISILIKRFTDRQENVRLDIMQTFISLLELTNSYTLENREVESHGKRHKGANGNRSPPPSSRLCI